MDLLTIALFGEAEKGEFTRGYFCESLFELMEFFGNPPPDSKGLYYAIQALHYHHPLVFFRVQEEGFSLSDYMFGLETLEKSPFINKVSAICTPGVGDAALVDAIVPICKSHHQIWITNESDLYDYLAHPVC